MLRNFRIFVLACLIGQVSAQSTQSIIAENNLVVQYGGRSDSTTQKTKVIGTIQRPKSDSATLKAAQAHRAIQRFKLDSMDYKVQTATRLEVTGNYMSGVRYSGRDYGVKGYGLSTQLSLKHKSGFWLSTIGYNWQQFAIKVPKLDLVAGYSATLGEGVGASVSYSRWLYFGKSQSELKWAFNHFMSAYLGINTPLFTIAPQFYYMISPTENVAQFAVSISKNKEWRPFWGGKLIFEPNLTWMSSTTDRYDVADNVHVAGKMLRVIDYELGLPLIYRRVGKYELTARYILSLPVNVSKYDGVEEGKLVSLFSVDYKHIIWRKEEKKKHR